MCAVHTHSVQGLAFRDPLCSKMVAQGGPSNITLSALCMDMSSTCCEGELTKEVGAATREEAAARREKQVQQLDKRRREAKKWEDLHAAGPVTEQLAARFSRYGCRP